MARLAPLLVLLAGLVGFLSANGCDLLGAVGQVLALPYIYEGLNRSHVLRWTHNKTVVFYRQEGLVSIGNTTDVSLSGSLWLMDLQLSSSGEYQVVVLDGNTPVGMRTFRVCVMDRVPRPQVSYRCDLPASSVHLLCVVANPQGVEFSWAIDGKVLTTEKSQKLSVSLKDKARKSFTCGVANKVSREDSGAVRPVCGGSTLTTPGFYCFSTKTVQAMFVGGAGLLLLLLAIIITLCCRCQRNRPHGAGDRGEYRMRDARDARNTRNAQETEYETMLSPEKPQPWNPEPYSAIPQPEDTSENWLPCQTGTKEGQRVSPVPKPRTKSPQTANIGTTKL